MSSGISKLILHSPFLLSLHNSLYLNSISFISFENIISIIPMVINIIEKIE